MFPGSEFKPVHLPTGARIQVGSSGRTGDGALELTLVTDDSVVSSARLPPPDKGLAGGGLIASPSGRFVVLGTYSGQSEERFVLFSVDGALRPEFDSGYIFGEAASYAFSPDESLLVMALPAMCVEWWTPWDVGDVEEGPDGSRSFKFGELHVLETNGGGVSKHAIRVLPPVGWSPTRESYDCDLDPRFLSAGRISLSMPWGVLEVDLPAPPVVAVPLGVR